jgi:hypothetical protein
VLSPATYFEVVGKVNSGNGSYIIHIRHICPPHPLIQTPFQLTDSAAFKDYQHISLLNRVSPFFIRQSDDQKEKKTPETDKLNFSRLKKTPRLTLPDDNQYGPMAASDEFLLYCPQGKLCRIDQNRNRYLDIDRNFNVEKIF